MANQTIRNNRRKTVIWSAEVPGGHVCVDLFRRGDDTYGFEEYRRDPEDGRGWYPVGGFGDQVFADQDAAETAARGAVSWLSGVTPTSGRALR